MTYSADDFQHARTSLICTLGPDVPAEVLDYGAATMAEIAQEAALGVSGSDLDALATLTNTRVLRQAQQGNRLAQELIDCMRAVAEEGELAYERARTFLSERLPAVSQEVLDYGAQVMVAVEEAVRSQTPDADSLTLSKVTSGYLQQQADKGHPLATELLCQIDQQEVNPSRLEEDFRQRFEADSLVRGEELLRKHAPTAPDTAIAYGAKVLSGLVVLRIQNPGQVDTEDQMRMFYDRVQADKATNPDAAALDAALRAQRATRAGGTFGR